MTEDEIMVRKGEGRCNSEGTPAMSHRDGSKCLLLELYGERKEKVSPFLREEFRMERFLIRRRGRRGEPAIRESF